MIPSLSSLVHAQNRRCYYCSEVFTRHGALRPTRDHYIPQWAGGTEEPENFVAACARCNGRKGPIPPEEYIRLFQAKDWEGLRQAYRRYMLIAKNETLT